MRSSDNSNQNCRRLGFIGRQDQPKEDKNGNSGFSPNLLFTARWDITEALWQGGKALLTNRLFQTVGRAGLFPRNIFTFHPSMCCQRQHGLLLWQRGQGSSRRQRRAAMLQATSVIAINANATAMNAHGSDALI